MAQLTHEGQQTLTSHTIDEDSPGTVWCDFDTLLRFIGPDGTAVRQPNNLANARLFGSVSQTLVLPRLWCQFQFQPVAISLSAQ
jgi:hypothetical protein